MPGLEADEIRALEISKQKGITLICASAASALTTVRPLDDVWWNDIELVTLFGPKEVDEQVMGCLETNQTLTDRDAEVLVLPAEVCETVQRMGSGKLCQGSCRLAGERDVMLVLAPIDTNVNVHG